ncbi:MAG: glycosyltransferase [Acidimicrobiia bacterium]
MHIVQLANFYGPRSGGLRTAVDQLAARYGDRGHRVTTIVPAPTSGVRSEGTRTIVSVRAPIAPFLGGDYRLILDRATVDDVIRRCAPDVIELSDKTTLVAPAARARRTGARVVLVSHERLDQVIARTTGCRAASRFVHRHNRRLLDRVDDVVCASRFAADELARHGRPIHHVPLGVELDRFVPGRTPLRARPRIVVAVRLSPEKSPGLLVDTSRALLEQGCDHEMVVYGDGPLRPRLERAARGLPVRFAGFLADRRALAGEMASADVGIAPGPLETFGLAALELLASGTPVVVPREGALAEIADGSAAVAADRTPTEFARAVGSLLGGERDARRRAARSLAEAYTWDRTADAMLAIFAADGRSREAAGQGRSYL